MNGDTAAASRRASCEDGARRRPGEAHDDRADWRGRERRTGLQPPVRILHVLTRLVRGGADENTLYTVGGLDPRRYIVSLAVGADSDPAMLAELAPSQLHRCRWLVRDPNPVKDVAALLELAILIRRGRYQIVHTHTAKAGFLGRLAAAMVGHPIIIHTVHGVTFPASLPAPLRLFYASLERVAGRFTNQFVTVGEDVRRTYVRAGIGRPEAYETIYSGMLLDDFIEAGRMPEGDRTSLRRELGYGPEHQVAVMIARLEERKGHVYLFQAVARLKPAHPSFRVLVIGEGRLRRKLEEQVRAMGLENVVTFLGYRTDVARILAAADLSVLTSLWEGLPRVLVQSAAAGRPIVTFDVEGAWEVVRDGENGYIVPTRDVDALTARLDQLLANRERARALGRAGPERVCEDWTVETMLERLDHLYQRWIGSKAA